MSFFVYNSIVKIKYLKTCCWNICIHFSICIKFPKIIIFPIKKRQVLIRHLRIRISNISFALQRTNRSHVFLISNYHYNYLKCILYILRLIILYLKLNKFYFKFIKRANMFYNFALNIKTNENIKINLLI